MDSPSSGEELDDAVLREEIELVTRVIVAASASMERLTTAQIDAILEVTSSGASSEDTAVLVGTPSR